MLSAQYTLRRIDESEQHGMFVHGKLYIVTGWIFEAPRMAVEIMALSPPAQGCAQQACFILEGKFTLNELEVLAKALRDGMDSVS
jgi:hypothetical protein